MPPFVRRHWVTWTLLLILLTAGWMRLNGRSFDGGIHFHPDERHVVDATMGHVSLQAGANYLDAAHSPMNPRVTWTTGQEWDFHYGTLPLYIVKGADWAAQQVVGALNQAKITEIPGGRIIPGWDGRISTPGYYADYDGVEKTGRTLAALFDLLTVFLVFLIGRRLYGRGAGVLAAAFSAFAVMQVQIAHFYIVESYLVTFMTAVLYFSVVLMQRPSWWSAAAAGLCLGFAIACKVTVAPLALVIIAALVLRAVHRRHTRILGPDQRVDDPIGLRPASQQERERSLPSALLRLFPLLVLAGLATILGFFIGDPYAFLYWSVPPVFDPQNLVNSLLGGNIYWQELLREADIQRGVADVPFTRQYVGSVPVVYHLQQIVGWGMGPASGLVALAALLWGLWRILRGRAAEVLLLGASLAYFATIATLATKWIRYMLPLVPYLCVLAAGLLVAGLAWSRRAGVVERTDEWARVAGTRAVRQAESFGTWARRWAFPLITTLAVGGSLAWAVAYQSIYSQEFSSKQAARWLVENAPPSFTLGQEHWDETLPMGSVIRPGIPPPAFSGVEFAMYDDRPSPFALQYIKDRLAQTDYIVENTNRLYKTIPKLPWRYPVQTRYYELLFAEKLGFKLVHVSQVAPSIFGITFDDQGADESFTVYDHPKVLIFQKVADLSDDEIATLFGQAVNRPSIPTRSGTNQFDKSLMLDQPTGQLLKLGDYNWNPLAQSQPVALLLWLLVVEGLGLLAWPLVALVCRRLPDRGYPLAKIVGLLLVAWLTWLGASAHLVPFTVWSIGAAIVVLGLAGLAIWRRIPGELGAFVRQRAWLILGWEAVFLFAFGFFLFIRMLNPDLWQPWNGGEKPMEFAFLNGILRSPWMPPLDPFYSDGYINYYYFGQFICATLIKFVGVDSAVGFNLVIATLYGFMALGAGTVVYNCVALVQRARGWRTLASRTAFGFGLLGAFLMVGIGNLYTAINVLVIQFPQLATSLMQPLVNLGVLDRQIVGSMPRDVDYWGAAHAVIQDNSITEFPYWSFLFSDLHPHLINLAFTVLAAALALNLLMGAWRWPAFRASTDGALDDDSPAVALPTAGRGNFLTATLYPVIGRVWGAEWGDGLLRLGLTGLALGTLAAVNTWDFPAYAGITGVGLVGAAALAWRVGANRTGAARLAMLVAAVSSAILVTGVGLLLYAPFFLSFKAVAVGGLKQLVPQTVPFLMRRTTMGEFVTMWGLFLFIALSYLAVRLWHFPWREAVADWGRLGRLTSPFGSAQPAPALAPGGSFAPRYPEAAQPNFSSTRTDADPVAHSNGHNPDLSPDDALPHALPALGFLPSIEQGDNGDGGNEQTPGLYPALARNGNDESDEPMLHDAGALGLGLDEDEVRRHALRPVRVTHSESADSNGSNLVDPMAGWDDNLAPDPAFPVHLAHSENAESNGSGVVDPVPGWDGALAPDPTDPALLPEETAGRGRRSVPAERHDPDPIYTVRVPDSALRGEPTAQDVPPAEEVALPATDGVAGASPGDDANLAATMVDPAASAEVADLSAGGAPVNAMEVEVANLSTGDVPVTSVDTTPPTVEITDAAADDGLAAPMTGEQPTWASEAGTEDALTAEASGDFGTLAARYEGEAPDAPEFSPIQVAPDLTSSAESSDGWVEDAPAVEPAALVTESRITPVDDGLIEDAWRPAEEVVPEPPAPGLPQRGVLPAGLGLLLLGLTGALTALLVVRHEGLLALLALLIGGLIATHIGGVRAPGTLFAGVLLAVALAISMFVELFYLADFLAGSPAYRMNTVFKFYMQVWVLLSMGSAVALYVMVGPKGRAPRPATVPAFAPAAPDLGDNDPSPFHYTPVASLGVRDVPPPPPVVEDDALGWLVPPVAPAPLSPAPDTEANVEEILVRPMDAWADADDWDAPPVVIAPPDGVPELSPATPAAEAFWARPTDAPLSVADVPPSSEANDAEWDVPAPHIVEDSDEDDWDVPPPPIVDEADDDLPAPLPRPGLGPGTYDPDGLMPPPAQPPPAAPDPHATSSDTPDALDAPYTPPVPTWDSAEGAAWADAAENAAGDTLPAEDAPQVIGYEENPPPADESTVELPVESNAFAVSASPSIEDSDPAAPVDGSATAETVDTASPASADVADVVPVASALGPMRRVVLGDGGAPPVLPNLATRPIGPEVTRVLEPLPVTARDSPWSILAGGGRIVWFGLLILLLLASFVFTVAGTRARVSNRFPEESQRPAFGTLNGMDWMDKAQYNICFNNNQQCGTMFFRFEREALEWMRAHIDGAPTVADDPQDYYRGSGCMVGTYTGLPILLCPQHEGEQRYPEQVGERSGDADELFRTESSDRARILMAKYNVEYIYVGGVSRIARKDIPGATAKWDDMLKAGQLEMAFQNTGVKLYHVKPSAAPIGFTPGQPRPSPTPRPTPTEPPVGSDPKLIQLEAAVANNPTDIVARQELANYYRQLKVFSKAVIQYQEVLKLSPLDVATYQQLGDTYQEMGDLDKALAAWEEAVKQVPDNPDAHNKVGIAYSERGRYDDAVREFQRTLDLNPKFVEAAFRLGGVYETLQQKDKAIAAYQLVLKNGADSSWVQEAQRRLDALK